MPTLTVDGLKQVIIMQKMKCRVQNISCRTEDVQYNGAVSYKHKLI